MVPELESVNRGRPAELETYSLRSRRWMQRICTIDSVTVLGELGIHALSLKQAIRAVSEEAVGAV